VTSRISAVGPKRDGHKATSVSSIVSSVAASPWALSCSSFVLTALLIRSNGLTVF